MYIQIRMYRFLFNFAIVIFVNILPITATEYPFYIRISLFSLAFFLDFLFLSCVVVTTKFYRSARVDGIVCSR